MCPRGLALLVQRGCLSFNAADTGDVPACTRAALSGAGTRPAGTCVPRDTGSVCPGTAAGRGWSCVPRIRVPRGAGTAAGRGCPAPAEERPLPPGSSGAGPGLREQRAGGKCEADAAIALLKEPGLAVPSYRPCNPVSRQSPFRKSFISL